jgi:glycosyltransferase involved in cell wall biosynthesis
MRGDKIRIGFFGTRGVPASYSGFETFYDKLIKHLSSEPDFEITVFNRSNYLRYPFRYFKGAKVISLPSLPQKHLDTLSHTFLSFLYSLYYSLSFDIALICIVGNSAVLPFFKAFGIKTILNVDGEDWRRKKWGKISSFYLRLSEKIAGKFADIIVADALEVKKYYEKFCPSHKIVYIPYGGLEEDDLKRAELLGDDEEFLSKFGIERRKYFLFVGRLVPENSPHVLISAFKRAKDRLPKDFKLVIVGDAPYETLYKDYLRGLSKGCDSIVFTGYQFSSSYIKLSQNAFSFVLCATVGGTHPVLVEQMSIGSLIISYDTPSNREVLGDCGFYFSSESELEKILVEVVKLDEEKISEMKSRAKSRARESYSWKEISMKYAELFRNVLSR